MTLSVRNCVIFFVFGYLLTVVNSQCTDGTRPYQVNATHEPQYITSPNYPIEYAINQDCAWLVTAPSESDRIIINIEDLDIEGITTPCKYDSLTIFDGMDNTSSEVAKLCNANKDDVNVFVSTADTLYITFVSDYEYEFNGFQILVFANNTAYQPACSVNTSLTATSEPQVLMSSNLPDPYEPNLICLINIYPQTKHFAIRIDLYFMDMHNSTGCENGSLAVSGITDITTNLMLTDCRSAITYTPSIFPLEVTGSYVQLNFSTGDVDGNYYGYMLKYYEIFKGINMSWPENGATIQLSFPEDEPTGHLNESLAVVVLTYTGSLDLQILPSYEVTTDKIIDIATDIQIFSLTDDPPYIYLDLVSNFDYETINKFSLLVTIIDTDVPLATFSVTFNITISDVNDVAPTFDNLPSNQTIMRGEEKGYYLYTVNATDKDGTEPNRHIEFEIFSGNDDAVFQLDAISGNLTLLNDAKNIPIYVTEYVLVIGAYSDSSGDTLAEFSAYTVYIYPDSPPTCTHDSVWTETLDFNLAVSGDTIQFLDAWSCSDDQVNITFELGSVIGNLTSDLFDVSAENGDIALLRTFAITEVLERQFIVEIIVTDSVGQMENFLVYMNVTALTCVPNPRRLYVRMDQEIDGVILSNFNCTNNYGMSYSLKQYPGGTFDVTIATDDSGQLVLRKPVLKSVFYSLAITITDNLDIAKLEFQVVVQTRRHSISGSQTVQPSLLHMFICWVLVFLTQCVLFEVKT